MPCGHNEPDDQNRQAEGRADDMRDHVHAFFAGCIVGKLPLPKGNPFHASVSFSRAGTESGALLTQGALCLSESGLSYRLILALS